MGKIFTFLLFICVINLHATISMQPYLMGVQATSVYVLVECSTTAAVTVNYGLTTSYGSTATDETYTATTASPVTYVHKIKLTGLAAGTVYHYQAVQGTSTSADYNFKSAPAVGSSFRFAFQADERTNTSPHDQISALIKTANPVLLLQGGDVCTASTYSYYKSEFFRTNELNNISYIPFIWAAGNHEGWTTNTQAFSKAPNTTSGAEDYYSFDYGDIHFLVLDTQTSYASGSAQYNFAASDLSSTTKRWKIVVAHIPGYTYGGSGAHTTDANMITMSTNIFTPDGVDLVLNGHNHFYQHNKVSNVDYIVIGSAGAPLYTTSSNASYTIKSSSTYCYGIFDFTPTSLKMNVYDNVGALVDSLTWNKSVLPVEITTFNGAFEKNHVKLNWTTATELNNLRFDIERSSNNKDWTNIGSIPGSGNSSSPKKYSFVDKNLLLSGKYYYRLVQVDIDGKTNSSKVVNVDVNVTPQNYYLGQNYPNPFNPTTTIDYVLPSDSYVKLTIYDALGNMVKQLVDGVQAGGSLSLNVSATELPSGIYFYTLQARSIEGGDNFTRTNKMVLLK